MAQVKKYLCYRYSDVSFCNDVLRIARLTIIYALLCDR
ncbi:hypothetical protein Cal7507_2619 [Calothrix sp. PCC 7507]|nr:hypothetical protein Cal7507_2619 [Calothrix sp. PCC 7507]